MTRVLIMLQEQQDRMVIVFGDRIEKLLIGRKNPADLQLRNKRGFFGIEVHIKTPVEMIAIALLARLFKSYTILVVDSFQLMNYEKSGRRAGDSQRGLSDAVGKTKYELEQIAITFNLNFDIAFCSQFFTTGRYQAVLKEVDGIIEESPEFREKLRRSIPENRDRNDLSYVANQVASVAYMGLVEGVDVKVGQSREVLYDSPLRLSHGQTRVMKFAYLIPFYAFGKNAPEEVTPYRPTSGTKNRGKRILIDDFDERNYKSIVEHFTKGPLEAQMSFYRLALAAGLLTEEFMGVLDHPVKCFLNNVVRPYDIHKMGDVIEKACNNI